MHEATEMYKSDFRSLKFKCFVAQECPKQLSYDHILRPDEHLKECKFTQYQCKHCRIIMSKKLRIKHLYECESIPKICKYCKKTVALFRYSEHLKIVHRDEPEANDHSLS